MFCGTYFSHRGVKFSIITGSVVRDREYIDPVLGRIGWRISSGVPSEGVTPDDF